MRLCGESFRSQHIPGHQELSDALLGTTAHDHGLTIVTRNRARPQPALPARAPK